MSLFSRLRDQRTTMLVAPAIVLCFILSMIHTADAAFASLPSTSSTSSGSVGAFSGQSRFLGNGRMKFRARSPSRQRKKGSSSDMTMFMGTSEGIFGVGAPEVAVILVVGYFILGPTELYSLVKEIGKFVQNIRTLGTDAAASFENSMEDQLDMQELRKAQRELNDAFSFRRSINVDTELDPFESGPMFKDPSLQDIDAGSGAVASTAAGAAATNKKRKRRRVKKKKAPAPAEVDEALAASPTVSDIPDLDMSSSFPDVADSTPDTFTETSLKEERMARLTDNSNLASEVLAQQDPVVAMNEQSRFAAQLAGDWNQQILDNEDKLSPLAAVMEQIAMLEEERLAAERRLTEEYEKKAELEEFYYKEKRKLLESAAAQVQADAYSGMSANEDILPPPGPVTNLSKTEDKVNDTKSEVS